MRKTLKPILSCLVVISAKVADFFELLYDWLYGKWIEENPASIKQFVRWAYPKNKK